MGENISFVFPPAAGADSPSAPAAGLSVRSPAPAPAPSPTPSSALIRAVRRGIVAAYLGANVSSINARRPASPTGVSKKVTPRSAFAAAFAIFVVLALVNAAVSSPPAAATKRGARHARVRLEHVLAPFTSLTPARPVCPLQILRLFTQRAFRLVRRRRRALVVPPGRREDPTKRRRPRE